MLYGGIETKRWMKSKAIQQALDFLDEQAGTLPEGTHELENGIYAVIREYEPGKPEDKRFENHVQYADVQYMLAGVENVYFAALAELPVVEDKGKENDVRFHSEPRNETVQCIKLIPGNYIIFMPTDVHKPECFAGSKFVKKCVVKIPMKLLRTFSKTLVYTNINKHSGGTP